MDWTEGLRPDDPGYVEEVDQDLLQGDGANIQDYEYSEKTTSNGKAGSGAGASATKSSGVFSFFDKLTGAAVMTKEMLGPPLEKTRMHLIGKNVASDIAERIVTAVGENLAGTSTATHTATHTASHTATRSGREPGRYVPPIFTPTLHSATLIPAALCVVR
jgi:hypothetical protein